MKYGQMDNTFSLAVLFTLCIFSTSTSGQIIGNLTTECDRDFKRYLAELVRPFQLWPKEMLDSNGRYSSGAMDGHLFYEGDYNQCKNVRERENRDPEVNPAIRGLYCVSYWTAGGRRKPNGDSVLGWQRKGFGFCIPHTCTDEDAYILSNQFSPPIFKPPLFKNVYCVREKSWTAGAIGVMVMLVVFATLVLIATFLDVILQFCHSPSSSADNLGEIFSRPVLSIESTSGFDLFHSESSMKRNDEISLQHYNKTRFRGHNNIIPKGEGSANAASLPPANGHVNAYDNHVITTIEEVGGAANGEAAKNGVGNAATKKATANGDIKSSASQVEPKPVKHGKLVELVLSFSLKRNVPKLLSFKSSPGSLSCLNGIRVICTLAVIWGHTYYIGLLAHFAAPVVANRFSSLEMMESFWIEFINQMELVVDTFFCMSGLLVAYAFLNSFNKQKKNPVRMMVMYYFHRYWRLTPVYLVGILVYSNLFDIFGQGPFRFPGYAMSDYCSGIIWRSLLYIQNLWGPDGFKDCMGWAWYLAIDMQLYIIAPVFLIITYFWPMVGVPLMGAGYLGSIIANIVIHYQMYSGSKPRDDYIDIYIKPWTRAMTYFMGMVLGWVLYKTKGRILMNPIVVILGWIISMGLIYMAMVLPWLQKCDNLDICGPWTVAGKTVWDSLFATIYILGVCWVIFACVNGYGGFVNKILSWDGWMPLARLTYTMYIFHYMIIEWFYLTGPTQRYQTHYELNYQFCGHLIITLIVSFVMSLMFEKPLLGVEKVLLPKK